MHINVRDILAESVGYSRAYKIEGENPSLESVQLTKSVEGEVTISRLDSNLLAQGRVQTAIELECDRCLCHFNRPVDVKFRQLYSQSPRDDELPIDRQGEIDLAPVIGQEILLSLPIKILHDPDCPGITGRYTKVDTSTSLRQQARITNRTKEPIVAVPKKRTTRSAQGQRRSHLAIKSTDLVRITSGELIPRRLKRAADLGLLKSAKKA